MDSRKKLLSFFERGRAALAVVGTAAAAGSDLSDTKPLAKPSDDSDFFPTRSQFLDVG